MLSANPYPCHLAVFSDIMLKSVNYQMFFDMHQKLISYLLATLKYLTLFILIYAVVNFWRAPTLPLAPQLSYHTQQGQMIDVVSSSHQAPILVYFWGSWCGVCRSTSPNVQALHDDGYHVVTVAVSSGSDQELGAYMNQHQYSFTTINDTHSQIFSTWQGKVTPSFVILSDGKAVQSFTGLAPLWSLKLRLWWANV